MKKMRKGLVNTPLLDLVEEDMISWWSNSKGMYTI